MSPPDRHIGWLIPAMLIVAIWAVEIDGLSSRFVSDVILGFGLVALAWIDWRQMRLPDLLTLPLLLLGLAATAYVAPDDLLSNLVGALAGYSVLRTIDWCYRRARGQAGLGQGDAKLLAAGGAWLGWQALPWVVLLACLLGLVIVLALRIRGRSITRETVLPFGPPLAAAIWIVRLHGVPGM